MKRPLFVARQTYRQRRLRDAARLLPLLAVFLMRFICSASGFC
jgi:hypothetical protein